MGNCCGTMSSSSSVGSWGGDDWSFLTSSKSNRNKSSTKVFDELRLMNHKDNKLPVGDSSDSSSIKMKISKKELQLLLGKLEKQKKTNSAEQVLVRLMEARRQHDRTGQNWSPLLESIPEVN